MFCQECQKDYPENHFFLESTVCYRCIYLKKIKTISSSKKIKEYRCKICDKEFFIDKTKKFRQRNVYCSKECADRGHKYQMSNFWTNKIKLKLEFR